MKPSMYRKEFIFMTHSCKDVLNHLRKISENKSVALSYTIGESRIVSFGDSGKKYYDYSAHAGEFDAIIDELAKTGYLELCDDQINFSLTYKGLHPYAIFWDNLKPRLIWSVLVPIGVSIATSLLTVYITTLLSSL